MANINYQIRGGLSLEQIQRIHTEALGLIERLGLRIMHPPTLQYLANFAGISIEKDRARFRPELVQAAIAAQWYPTPLTDREFSINTGAYELNMIDLENGALRPPTYQDLVDLTKLAHSLGMHGSAPVIPLDLPPLLQELAMHKVSWEYSDRRPGGIFDANPISSIKSAEYTYEMAQAAGKFLSLGLWVISPFMVPADTLEIIYHFRGRGLPLWIATMPVMGTTAPIFLPGAYVQSVAELLAGLTLIHLLADGAPIYCSIIDSIRAYPFDMRYGAFVYGSPEDLLATLVQGQLNAFYSIPWVAKAMLTTGKQPDAQAAAEKTANTLAAALMGARIFTCAGLLAVDEIYSAEQLVIDYEIVQYVARVCQGFEFNDQTLAIRAIEEMGQASGSFLYHRSTFDNFKKTTWMPDLFEHTTMGQWQEKGQPSITDQARKIARKRIANHEYQLEEEKRRDLELIYQRAKKETE